MPATLYSLLIAVFCFSVVVTGQAHEFEIYSFIDYNETDFYISSIDVENNFVHSPSNKWKENLGVGYNYFFNKRKKGFNLKARLGYTNRNFEDGSFSDSGIFFSGAFYKAEYIDVYSGLGYEFKLSKFSFEPALLLGVGIPLWRENEKFTGNLKAPDPLSMGGLLIMLDVNFNIEYKLFENLKNIWSIGLQPRMSTYFTSMYDLENHPGSNRTTPHFGFGFGINTSYYFR